MTTVLAIDPSKKNTGWALFKDGELIRSGSCEGIHLLGVPRHGIDVVVCERPGAANRCFGFKNRDEIVLVAGHVLGITNPQRWRWVEISAWRKEIYGASNLYKKEEWKAAALERAADYNPSVSSHDEAEAILIGVAAHRLGLAHETKARKKAASPGQRGEPGKTTRPRKPRARTSA